MPIDSAPTGVGVRGHLSIDGSARARELTGRDRRTINGRLLRVDETHIEFGLPVRREPGRLGAEGLYESLTLARGDVVELELRRLDRMRTVGIVAVAAAAVGVLLVRSLSGDSGGGSAPPGPGGTESRGPASAHP